MKDGKIKKKEIRQKIKEEPRQGFKINSRR